MSAIAPKRRLHQCDACGRAMTPLEGRTCPKCRRTLCSRHYAHWPSGNRRGVCVDCERDRLKA